MKDFEKEAVALIEEFRTKMRETAEDILSNVYVDLLPHIESDAWLNFRNSVREEVQGSIIVDALSTEYGPYSFGWETRKKIFEEHREDLIQAINLDHLAEIERLKQELKKSYGQWG